MNLRRGFFRLWLAGSLFWTVLAGFIVYDRHGTAQDRAASQAACVEGQRKIAPQDRNPFACARDGIEFGDLLPLRARISEFALLVAPPVAGRSFWGSHFCGSQPGSST
jgi:hypothetical protein